MLDIIFPNLKGENYQIQIFKKWKNFGKKARIRNWINILQTKEYIIQYGTCLLKKDGSLSKINEKPKYEFLINTGLYVLNPDVLKFIPEKEFFHLTHLIERVNNNGKKIGVYPIDDEAWLDVGVWAEYEKTIEKLKKE